MKIVFGFFFLIALTMTAAIATSAGSSLDDSKLLIADIKPWTSERV